MDATNDFIALIVSVVAGLLVGALVFGMLVLVAAVFVGNGEK